MSCKVKGCNNIGKLHRSGKRYFPRGFCNTHYKKWNKKNRDIVEEGKKPVTKCWVSDCDKKGPYKKGMCSMHYRRNKLYGDPEYTTIFNEGQTNYPLYNTYQGMKKRCLNKKDKDFSRYGGRGIEICERWLGPRGFFNFIEDMGEKPEGYTLDRINNDEGYKPDNCRWADIYTQAINKRGKNSNGVSFHNVVGKYRARISVEGNTYMLGFYTTLEEAIEARRLGEIKYLGSEVIK